MTLYAKIDAEKSTIIGVVSLEDEAVAHANMDPDRGKPFLLPVVETKPSLRQGEEYAGHADTVTKDHVARVWSVRAIHVPSPAERIDEAFPQTDTATVLMKIILDHENRIRALEGKAAITMAQLKTALGNMLSTL